MTFIRPAVPAIVFMPADTTHFELFGFPQSFDIDLDRLDRTYRELQRTLHPDRFANTSDYEQRLSVQKAAWVNEAYQALKDPLKRARYLLEIHGHPLGDEHHTTRDTEFLLEQMALRESLAEVREANDPLAELESIGAGIGARMDQLTGLLQDLLAVDESGEIEGPVDAAIDAILKMTFFRRLQEEIFSIEAGLEDELL